MKTFMLPEIGRWVPIEYVLEQEDYILCDCSLTSEEESDWYGMEVYDAHSFSEINHDVIKDQIDYMKTFSSILKNPKTSVVEGVTLELERFSKMLGDKIKFLKERKIGKKVFRSHGESFREKRNYGGGELRENLICELQEIYHDCFEHSRRISFLAEQKQRYDNLEKIVLSVTEKTKAKGDRKERRQYYRKNLQDVEDFHTDEQVVAAALYLSGIEGKEGCILTRDSDIRRILLGSLFYLYDSFIDEFKEIISSVEEKRIRIYFPCGEDEVICNLDTSNVNLSKTARLPFETFSKIDRELVDLNGNFNSSL